MGDVAGRFEVGGKGCASAEMALSLRADDGLAVSEERLFPLAVDWSKLRAWKRLANRASVGISSVCGRFASSCSWRALG